MAYVTPDERKQVATAYNRQQVVRLYAALAGLAAWEQHLIERYCSEEDTLLVAGCGAGREAFHLARKGFSVIGIDIAREMVRQANARRQSSQTQQLWFQHGDLVHLPYRGGCFDQALLLAVMIQYIPQRRCRQQALREIYRVLKPGGHLLLSTYNTPISLLYVRILIPRLYSNYVRSTRMTPSPSAKQTAAHTPPQRSFSARLRQMYRRLCPRSQEQQRPFLCQFLTRIAQECVPLIGNISDPLPLWYRVLYAGIFAGMNSSRKLRRRFSSNPDNIPEPNDFWVDVLTHQWSLFSRKGDLFMHFPDVDEIIEDLTAAGFTVKEYRSAEEFQQGIVFPDKIRHSKRLLFYVAQKQ